MVQKRSELYMIEIVTDKDRNLKNLKQIGTPREEDKIYIENFAYAKLKEASYKEKRVFVLMGHTERMQGKYATFVEAVISVKEIEFVGGVPRWNTTAWSEAFREIKRLYEDMIIVGWALDIKGMSPKLTPELERMHREHFGGAHQLLLLLDTLEQEETFYMYKENRLIPKEGFYIYHRARKETNVSRDSFRKVQHEARVPQQPEIELELDIPEGDGTKGGRYRQLIQEKKTEKPVDNGNIGLAIAVAMLVFVVGVGVYENRGDIFGNQGSIETNLLQEQKDTETDASPANTEEETETSDTENDTATSAKEAEKIPVEVISGGEN